MTTFMNLKSKCCICGNEIEHQCLASTNAFGSMDLDMRPPEMQRSTMDYWSVECPNCGYVHDDIEELVGINKEEVKAIITSKEYKSCDGLNLKSDLAQKFYKQYLLHKTSTIELLPLKLVAQF